jgi:hypothetical protein
MIRAPPFGCGASPKDNDGRANLDRRPAQQGACSAPRASRKVRTWWLKQLHTWHWISAAVSLIGMMLFAITGLTLNHAASIGAKPVVTHKTATLAAAIARAPWRRPPRPKRPCPPPWPRVAAPSASRRRASQRRMVRRRGLCRHARPRRRRLAQHRSRQRQDLERSHQSRLDLLPQRSPQGPQRRRRPGSGSSTSSPSPASSSR